MSIFPVTLSDMQAIILAFTSALLVTWISIPLIIKVSMRRNLTDKPGPIKIHQDGIPTLGGIGIFLGFASGFLISVNENIDGVSSFMAALIVLLFIGIKDDLLQITPGKKIIIQVCSGLIISIFTNLRFTCLHGFLGINEIPVVISFFITIFLVVIIINSFNLIDGIDGLASSIGIIACIPYGTWFWFSGDYGYAIMASALIGALSVFLLFNVSKGKNKIFMGDTGSMVIGFIVAVMTIRFNEINAGGNSIHKLVSSPSISVAILIVPLFDTFRVIIIRLIRNKSLFIGDNRHIHHLLLRTGCTHKKATLLISIANIFIIAVAFLFDRIGIIMLAFILLFICVFLTTLVYIKVAQKEKWNWKGLSVKTFL
jgi:UDP-GlcNAc:undecaprenyl-phosphate GlcNAc-1-phosphate transferase